MPNETRERSYDVPWLFLGALLAAVVVASLDRLRHPTVPAPSEPVVAVFRPTVSRPSEVFSGPIQGLDHPDRLSASSHEPAGNDRTMQFLAWADNRSFAWCSMKLDPHGDCIHLDVAPCWPVKDEELEVISHLPRLISISFYAPELTERGLSALRRLPHLRTALIYGTKAKTRSLCLGFQSRIPNVFLDVH